MNIYTFKFVFDCGVEYEMKGILAKDEDEALDRADLLDFSPYVVSVMMLTDEEPFIPEY